MMIAGILCAVGAVLFLMRSAYERKHFVTEEFIIKSEKIKSDKTFVFLSDLHSNTFGRNNEDLIRAIGEVGPDGILIGGDMMVCKGKQEVDTALDLICSLAKRYPVYCGNGNHECRMNRIRDVYGGQYDEYKGRLLKAGVHYLEDETVYVGEDIAVSAIDIGEEYYKKFFVRKMKKEYLTKRLGEASKERFQILLAHSPLYHKTYCAWGADLSLAGHFHGGTIRIPLLGGVMTPQYQFFMPCCAGFFEKDGRYMIVSRGLGTHSINIRINNKPQVVVVKLSNKSIF